MSHFNRRLPVVRLVLLRGRLLLRLTLPLLILLLTLLPVLSATALELTPLVSASWLNAHLQEPDLVILDVRSAIDHGDQIPFSEAHIPGAIHSDYLQDQWRVTRHGVPGMLPPVADLERLIGRLGIDNQSALVLVAAGTGSTDFGSATRIYWTFKMLGHQRLAILDGGFRGWQEAGYAVATGVTSPPAKTFVAHWQPQWLAELDQMAQQISGPANSPRLLVDARPRAFFTGESKAWITQRAGTLPGAINLQQQDLLGGERGYHLLTPQPLSRLLQQTGLQRPATPITTFCTSGHWATIDWFVLHEVAGFKDVKVYDGSMVEWTQDEQRPVSNGREGIRKLLDLF